MKTIMKKRNFNWLLILTMVLVLVACSSSDDSDDTAGGGSSSADQVSQTAQDGTWRVSNYTDDGEDETSDYNGFVFTFNSDGSLVAASSARTLTGTWSVDDSDDSSDDDAGTDDDDFNIFFSVSDDDDFDDLVDDWDIVNVDSNTIALRDVSGGDGSIDLLTFSKN